jgi:riboflavin kinase/FMN adenylyltransferase
MKLIVDSADFRLPGAVVSIGMFDGVHRGHRKVLALLRERGGQLGLPTVVLTFDPHPRAVVRPDACPMLLSSFDDRMQLLERSGAVDHCLVLGFDTARSRQSADEFVLGTLVRRLGMRELVVGENFACGHGRQGDVRYLSAHGQRLGFTVAPVRLDAVPGTQDAVRSSSTEARRLIQLGDLAGASAVLERPHEMTGTVVRATRASRCRLEAELPPQMCTPAAADYVGAIRKGGSAPWIPALLRVRGGRHSKRHTVHLVADREVHADPGEQMRLRFVDRVRPDRSWSFNGGAAA